MVKVIEIEGTAIPAAATIEKAIKDAGISATIKEQPDQSFLGYRNYATGLTAMWIENEREVSAKYLTAADQNHLAGDLALMIRQDIERLMDRANVTGILSDLLNAAIVDVDYHALAIELIETVKGER